MANGTPFFNTIKLPTGQEVDIDRYGDYHLWSTAHGFITGVAQEIECFNYKRGDTVPGTAVRATKLDTNLDKMQGALGYSEEMMVHGISIQLPHQIATDLAVVDDRLAHDMVNLIDQVYFHFDVLSKVYSEGTIDCYPFFGGLYIESDVNNHEYVNNGMPMSGAAKPLALPIHITGKSSFRAVFEFPRGALAGLTNTNANNDYELRVWLSGIRSRYEGTSFGG